VDRCREDALNGVAPSHVEGGKSSLGQTTRARRMRPQASGRTWVRACIVGLSPDSQMEIPAETKALCVLCRGGTLMPLYGPLLRPRLGASLTAYRVSVTRWPDSLR
jgi:hypothetical protein